MVTRHRRLRNVTVINETAVPSNFALSVLSAGNGSGTVTGIPAGVKQINVIGTLRNTRS